MSNDLLRSVKWQFYSGKLGESTILNSSFQKFAERRLFCKSLKNIKNKLKDLRKYFPIQDREIEFTISCDADKGKMYVKLNYFIKFENNTSDTIQSDNIKDEVIKMLEVLNLENIEGNEYEDEVKIMFNLGEKGELKSCGENSKW